MIDKIKKVYEGFVKTIKKIGKALKFLATTIGFVIGCLILVAFCILVIYVVLRSMEHALNKLLDSEYGGISTEGDYEVIVSSIGYAGYEHFITEKLWQEYIAYEYAVLLDVSEYLYTGQTDFYAGKEGSYEEVNAVISREASKEGSNNTTTNAQNGTKKEDEIIKNPLYLPYLPVISEYDMSQLTFENWQKAVIEGQGSARFGFKKPEEIGIEGTGFTSLGGSREAIPPAITYEYRTNPNDDGTGSLVPYVTIVRENLKNKYYTIGAEGENGGRKNYEKGGIYGSNTENTGVTITEANIGDINLMEISTILNLFNVYLPKSTTIGNMILGDTANASTELLNNQDSKNWPTADESFEQSLYSTNDYTTTTYKIPLQTLVDRYLPKASLLTSWYLVKDSGEEDSETFTVEKLMKDIKGIYNYYCWNGEGIEYEEVEELAYDDDGVIIRNEDGTAQRAGTASKPYAGSNDETFVKFGQVGLESNRFSVFEFYDLGKAAGGSAYPHAATDVTGAEDEATIPVVTDLLSDNAHWLTDFTMDIKYEYEYEYDYIEEGWSDTDILVLTDPTEMAAVSRSGNRFRVSRELSGTPNADFLNDIRENPGYYNVVGYENDGSSETFRYKEKTETLVTATATATASTDVDYSQDNVTDGEGFDTLSDYFYKKSIKDAEKALIETGQFESAEGYAMEHQEQQWLNYEYLYPMDSVEGENGSIKGKILENIDDYDQKFAFYNFNVLENESGENAKSHDLLRQDFDDEILAQSKDLSGDEGFKEEVLEVISGDSSSPNPKPTVPNDGTFKRITKINSIEINGYKEDGEPTYKSAREYSPTKAVFDIDEQTISLTMNVPQLRMSAMLVTDVDTWAKSAHMEDDSITMKIMQNSFVSTNYRYVIPHSYFSFGLTEFNINEIGKYRTEYYKKYFSSIEGEKLGEPAIKEADTLAMLMKWEEAGKTGNDTAYVFMRDLYKLVMYIKEEGGILENAYSYLYVPDSIWNFREGVTQEAFWTERLAATGDDFITSEEQKKMIVKKNEIEWQVVDYDSYEECDNGDGTHSVYGLFPHGNEFARTYYMTYALLKGKCYDGNFKDGHAGADWYGRAYTKTILQQGDGIGASIYEYELKRLILQKLMTSSGNINAARNYLRTGEISNGTIYQEAENELIEKLEEYSLNSPLVAATTGYVLKARFNCYGGFSVHIVYNNDDGGDVKTTYAHMKRWPTVQEGDIVGPGTIVGYEGTTGNSGGYHCHVGMYDRKSTTESPSRYFAPIFSPFYNSEKAAEVLNEYRDNQELALSSDYFSIIRTVILPSFVNGKMEYKDGTPISSTPIPYIPEGHANLLFNEGISYMNNGVKNTLSGDFLQYNPKGLSATLQESIRNSDTFIIYYAGSYYVCETRDISYFPDNSYMELISYSPIEGDSPTVIDYGILVKTSQTGFDGARVVWGNNVPYEPLLTDTKLGYDLSILSLQKSFSGDDREHFGDVTPIDDVRGANEDVRAWSEFFDSEGSLIRQRMGVPAFMLIMLADIDNPDAVPFYDGPISVAYQNQGLEYGLPGTLSGDLQKLQIVLKQRGFDSENKMNTDGIYDEATAEVVKRMGEFLSNSPYSYGSYISSAKNEGNLGAPDYDWFDIRPIVAWNAYVTYGSLDNAYNAGKTAVAYASVQTGLDYNFVAGVAKRESGFMPTVESYELAYKDDNVLNFNDPSVKTPPRVTVKGVTRIIRRAQGIMQMTIGTGWDLCTRKGINDPDQIVAAIRTPVTNAILGAEYLRQQILTLQTSEADWVRQTAAQSNWSGLAKAAGFEPETLVEFAAAAVMYNKGPAALGKYKGEISAMTWSDTGRTSNGIKQFSVSCSAGYSGPVVQNVVNGGG